MVITATKNLQNNFYSTELMTEFDSNELAFIAAYGEPKIDVGGVIAYGESQHFTKDSSLTLIKSQFPVSFGLNSLSDADAVEKVDAWNLSVRTSLQTALNTLMANDQPIFPSTTVYSLHHS